jgi:hypothetical protein
LALGERPRRCGEYPQEQSEDGGTCDLPAIEQESLEHNALEWDAIKQGSTERAAIEHERLGTHYFDSSSGAKAARAGPMSAEMLISRKK